MGAAVELPFEKVGPGHGLLEVDEVKVAGAGEAQFGCGRGGVGDGTDDRGRVVRPGVYLIRFTGDGYTNIEDFINGLDPRAPKTDWTDLKHNVDRRNLPAPSARS